MCQAVMFLLLIVYGLSLVTVRAWDIIYAPFSLQFSSSPFACAYKFDCITWKAMLIICSTTYEIYIKPLFFLCSGDQYLLSGKHFIILFHVATVNFEKS